MPYWAVPLTFADASSRLAGVPISLNSSGDFSATFAGGRILAASALTSVVIDIPPGEKNYKASANATLPVDTEWISVTPHAHLLCREIKGDYTLPNGTKKPLVWIKNWDFDWQDQYMFKQPLKLPKGTVLHSSAWYDNSTANKSNPDPKVNVHWGEQTWEEMQFTAFTFTLEPQPGPATGAQQ